MLERALAQGMLRAVDAGNLVKRLMKQRDEFFAALNQGNSQDVTATAHQRDEGDFRQLGERFRYGVQVRGGIYADPEIRDDWISQLVNVHYRRSADKFL
jgi:hypothetical protein